MPKSLKTKVFNDKNERIMVIFTFFFTLSYAIFHAIFTMVALVLKAIVKLLSFIVHGILR